MVLMDYGLTEDVFVDISGSAYLFKSGTLADIHSTISASVPQIIAVTCSANTNNILTESINLNDDSYSSTNIFSSDKTLSSLK